MIFGWLKRYTPRGLYGRAALILIVPIVTILMIATLIFIQRHYQDVARQMTRAMSLELNMIVARIEAAEPEQAQAQARALSGPLQIALDLDAGAPPASDTRRWYDLSGPAVFAEFRKRMNGVVAVDMRDVLPDARVWVETGAGLAQFTFPVSRISAANPHQFLIIVLIVALVMGLIAYSFLRNQLRPIRRLALAAEAFGRGQVVPYQPAGATEVRSAGNAFLDMRARIDRQIEQRTLMLSGVSHDLRTPLTRLRLGLSMLDEVDEATVLGRDVDEMERMLDEFLDFARSDALDDPEAVEAGGLVRRAIARLPEGQDRVDVVLPDQAVSLMARPAALERALMNLIGNALRYGGRARVTLRAADNYAVLAVEDDGPGIPAAAREDALRPFVRLDAARNQNRGPGVGLGLAITSDIARRHGGTLRLGDSDALGGLKAEIVLPR